MSDTYNYITWFTYHGRNTGKFQELFDVAGDNYAAIATLGKVSRAPEKNKKRITFVIEVEEPENEMQFAQTFRHLVYNSLTLPKKTSWLAPIRTDRVAKQHSSWLTESQQEHLRNALLI